MNNNKTNPLLVWGLIALTALIAAFPMFFVKTDGKEEAFGGTDDGAEAVVNLDGARGAHVDASAAADALVSVDNGVRHGSLLSQRAQGPQILSEHGSPYSRLRCLHTSQPSTAGRVA